MNSMILSKNQVNVSQLIGVSLAKTLTIIGWKISYNQPLESSKLVTLHLRLSTLIMTPNNNWNFWLSIMKHATSIPSCWGLIISLNCLPSMNWPTIGRNDCKWSQCLSDWGIWVCLVTCKLHSWHIENFEDALSLYTQLMDCRLDLGNLNGGKHR